MRNTIINKHVTITAVGFTKNLTTYPRQMEYDGRTYDFVDAGLSCRVKREGRLSQILTVSDGQRQFRLRSDNRGGLWTLLTMSV
jgi:hypothetical protein